ncbi:uncharacterized protein ARMOST_06258 [Armillaria ostoyae]|uniref:Uncharacterized protein n=1 Tax=Armillaria ostoyae TaxID=47428 RepID=A0A284R2G7_ARMOS|nr:uncharacterized protein ARMOST_06258 [Armillaria ostoyae]
MTPQLAHRLYTSKRTSQESVAAVVSDETTVFDIITFLHHGGYIPSLSGLTEFALYLPGRFMSLQGYETMQELGISSLAHFQLRLRIPRGVSSSSDQCALNEDGTLKDASEIQFFHDADSAAPLKAGPSNAPAAEALSRCGHRQKRTSKLSASLTVKQQDEDGNIIQNPIQPQKQCSRKAKGKAKAVDDGIGSNDEVNNAYSDSDSGSEDKEEDDEEENDIPNEELANMLPSKTISLGVRPTDHQLRQSLKRRPKKNQRVSVEVEASSSAAIPNPASQLEHHNAARSKKKSAVHYFFEPVQFDTKGDKIPGEPGDKHYWCLHGSHKVITILATSQSNLTTLINHLKVHFPAMHQLYTILHGCAEPPTEEEIEIAAGKWKLDVKTTVEYLKKLEIASENIVQAFQRQAAQAAGEWDQAKFECLLLEWIVACDQPFEEIGEDVMASLMQMFSELEAKVSISLDVWTSPNGYAFMAIIAHYVNNKGKLEETLIDFRELLGKHSGDNMADVVWETLKVFGLIGWVMAFVMDNATNNDTMVDAIEQKCFLEGIDFSARESWLRCMPHTVHLAAIKLLEAIGEISPSERKKAETLTRFESVHTCNFAKCINTYIL